MSWRKRASVAVLATCTAVSLALVGSPSASAHRQQSPAPVVLSDSAIAPFNLTYHHGKLFVSDGFKGTIGPVGGKPLVTGAPGTTLSDIAWDGRTYAYTSANEDHSDTRLTIRTPGKRDVVARISAYEAKHNPDGRTTYGIIGGGNACAEAILGQMTGGPATYQGQVDSNPYSVSRVGSRWIVADAGANALFAVTDRGHVSTLAVMPRQSVTLTESMVRGLAASQGQSYDDLKCLVGVRYAFEPVPTDVEQGRWGELWVSLLPGGPEDPSLGARGSVYVLAPWGGNAYKVAGGFAGATNLAIASDGTVYVAELFGGKVSKIQRGRVSTAIKVDRPLSVEVHGRDLYVGQMADLDFETGQVKAPGAVLRYKR